MKSVVACRPKSLRRSLVTVAVLVFATLTFLPGCQGTDAPKKVAVRYPTLPKKDVPDYLQDTILSYTDLTGTDPFPISGYGLVANLNGTGGGRVPKAVREYMIKEMARHGFGMIGRGLASPEDVLANKSFAIVRVDGLIPPGARSWSDTDNHPERSWYTWFDVKVTALAESDTTSLAHGDLYLTDLKVNGANPLEPGSGNVTVKSRAEGSVFINPAYALPGTGDSTAAKASRLSGVVLGGAMATENRPLILRLRSPELRMSRAIERRINEQFQDVMDSFLPVKAEGAYLADAQDEGIVYVLVPKAYSDDWEHFAGVMKHLYMRGGSPQFAALKAQQLADAAVKPDARLLDISFCWEGLGKPALHAISPLMMSNNIDVQYAATRAAAFIGDPEAVPVLVAIARSQDNPFHLNAVRALGQMPSSPIVDHMLRTLLQADEAQVRTEAYQILARHNDSSITTRVIKRGEQEKFILDVVQGPGKPMVYATSQGLPRIALFGQQTAIEMPIACSAIEGRLSIASREDGNSITLFYRGRELDKPVKINSGPDLEQIAARLGGDGPRGSATLDFNYADVVAILQSLIDSHKVSGEYANSRQLAAFMLQEPPKAEEAADTSPLLRPGGRPQSDHSSTTNDRIDNPSALLGANLPASNQADVK